MAGDLIPPPSPAGRPAPDPESSLDYEPQEQPEAAAPPAAPLPPSPFRGRFGFVMGALLGCALAAGLLLLVELTSGGRSDSEGGLARDWSTWKPNTVDTFTGADEIARHIQGTYRNEKRKPLASVTGGPIAVGPYPLAVAIPSGDQVQILNGNGIQYTLGGAGKGGALKDSKPSRARHRLLRREALELALYSFRYLPHVTMVVTLLPPAPKIEQIVPKPKNGKATKAETAKQPAFQKQALFYRPGDLKPQLQVPLRFTMAPNPPPIDHFAGEEARRIDSLTLSNLFLYARTQGQDGRAYLVLERPK